MTRMLAVKNWAKYQHYRDRNPPWIKLHVEIFTSQDWVMLDDASKLLAVVCMVIAAQHDGCVPDDPIYIQRRAYLAKRPNLKPLIECGFLSEVLAADSARKQAKADARPEKETEAEAEAEKEAEQNFTGPQAVPKLVHNETALAISAYNEVAEGLGWPIAQAVTESRTQKLKARLRECGGLEGWRAAMQRASASAFLRGEEGRDKRHEKWTPDLDFFLQQTTFTRLMEGKYDNRASNQKHATGFNAIVAGARAAASRGRS